MPRKTRTVTQSVPATPKATPRKATAARRKATKGAAAPSRGNALAAKAKASASLLSANATADRFDPLGYAKKLIRGIPDFPIPGILFRDITPVLADARAFHAVIDAFVARFVGEAIDAIVAIESRGFIFGAALAARLNVSFVPVRRPGKLPAAADRVSYKLEYGSAQLEMHTDALKPGARVVVIDDLLATGGTAKATAKLVKRRGGKVLAYAFVIELEALPGRRVLAPTPVVSLVRF